MLIELKNYKSTLDRGASRVKELFWIIAKILFFYPKYPLPSGFRCWLLKAFGAKVGTGVVIRSGVDITFPWKLRIDDYSWIGEEAKILNLAHIFIGSNCCVSQRAFLCTGSHDFQSKEFDLVVKPIILENSSWVAAQCFVGPGVTVGEGAMIAAGGVVISNVPRHHVLSGNPAKIIRKLSADKDELKPGGRVVC